MNSKSVLKSKTFWVNALTLAATAITFAVDNQVFQNPDVTAAMVGVLALVNVGLRFVTKDAVTLTNKPSE